MTYTPKHNVPQKVRFEITKFMDEVVEDVGEGIVRYVYPWSDEKMVEKFRKDDPKLTLWNIRSIRHQVFGHLWKAGREKVEVKKANGADQYSRIVALEKEVGRLSDLVRQMHSVYVELSK